MGLVGVRAGACLIFMSGLFSAVGQVRLPEQPCPSIARPGRGSRSGDGVARRYPGLGTTGRVSEPP
jgi:hypothetical protein